MSDSISKEGFDLPTPVQRFFDSEQSPLPDVSALSGSLFPQLPHPTLPPGRDALAPSTLPKNQQSYYLRLFWDVCHPLTPVLSELEFIELDSLQPTTLNECSAKHSLVDAVIAIGIQHSHITGLARRVAGLRHTTSQLQQQATPSSEAGWPGFQYFNRCRESMRTNKELTLDRLRCHILMIVYFIRGNAFTNAYNVLGITVRKAYIAKLHRSPPSHLPEAERMARMQLWSTLFSLDVQCSLQLDMPTAIQKSLVKCSFPDGDALARYISPSLSHMSTTSPYAYSASLTNLAVVVTDASACASAADLDDEGDDDESSITLEAHALKLSSALQTLELWRDQLPSDLLLKQFMGSPGVVQELDFHPDLAIPQWLLRQAVLIALQYHNAYTLIQRPFIRIYHTSSNKVNSPGTQQPHVEQHIASAFRHATIIVDIVFTVCSSSDILYGWSEVLQPLWNATLTIVAYAYTYNSSLDSAVPQAIESLTRSQAIFESFSSTSPSSHSAKEIVQSLVNSLQVTMTQGSSVLPTDDPMSWDLFASLLEEPLATSTDLPSDVLFPPYTPSISNINTRDFTSPPVQFDYGP